MGTRMAPSYANLFLAKFEIDALSRVPDTSLTRGGVTYIDDVFMIWTHSVDDLQTFPTYLNNIHPPSNLHLTILSHPYHFLTSTCLSLTGKS